MCITLFYFMSRKALLQSLTGPFAPTGRSEAGDGAGRPGEQQGQEHLPVPAPQADRAQLLEGRPGPRRTLAVPRCRAAPSGCLPSGWGLEGGVSVHMGRAGKSLVFSRNRKSLY